MMRLIDEAGLYCDVVSGGGDLHRPQGRPEPKGLYFHGNNRDSRRMEMAIEEGVGTIVIDHAHDLDLIEDIATEPVSVLLRVNPGIRLVATSTSRPLPNDSKFGMSIGQSPKTTSLGRQAGRQRPCRL